MVKKSLERALREAEKHSKEYPEVTIKVMDMKGKRATYTAFDWIYRERVLEGYHTVATYKNGERLGA